MDRDRIKGKTDQVKGKMREKTGELTGNDAQRLKGKAEQAGGKVREDYGKLKDEARASQKKGEERRDHQADMRQERGIDDEL